MHRESSEPRRTPQHSNVPVFVFECVLALLFWRFIWRPLGAMLALVPTSLIATHIRHNMPWWGVRAAFIIGAIWGSGMALYINWLAVHSIQSVIGTLLFYILGFTPVGYVGYGITKRNVGFVAEGVIPVTGTLTYLLTIGILTAIQPQWSPKTGQ